MKVKDLLDIYDEDFLAIYPGNYKKCNSIYDGVNEKYKIPTKFLNYTVNKIRLDIAYHGGFGYGGKYPTLILEVSEPEKYLNQHDVDYGNFHCLYNRIVKREG